MNIRIILVFVLFSNFLNAQDMIKMTNGASLDVKIKAVNPETVTYSVSEDRMDYFMVKNDIDEIKYADGKVEKMEHPQKSVEEIKSNIIRYFTDYVITDKDGVKLTALFEDNYLRIKEDKKSAEGSLFDMLKAFRFDPVSFRKDREMDAFVNVWTMVQTGKSSWEKYKLVVRTQNHEVAELLSSAFKQLNKALIKNKYH